jgi:hypothetical protein
MVMATALHSAGQSKDGREIAKLTLESATQDLEVWAKLRLYAELGERVKPGMSFAAMLGACKAAVVAAGVAE